MTTTQTRLEADVRALLHDGGDPTQYRRSLAELRGVSVEAVDAAIAAVGGTPRTVHPEDLAQERLAADRRARQQNRAAWRAYHHEEE